MNLQEWASLADIVGAVALIATLVYLALQIRQSNRAMRASNATTVLINTQSLAQTLMTDRELAKIVQHAVINPAELSPPDKMAAYAWFYQLLKTGELAHQSYLHGELDREFWDATMNFYRAYYQTPGFRRYWQDRKEAFTLAFRQEVEKWMNEASTAVTRPEVLWGVVKDDNN